MEVRGFTRAGLGKGGQQRGVGKEMLAYGVLQREIVIGGLAKRCWLMGFCKGSLQKGVGKEMLAYRGLQREIAKGGLAKRCWLMGVCSGGIGKEMLAQRFCKGGGGGIGKLEFAE